MDKKLIQKVGFYCRAFRMQYMELSLTEFCELENLNIKNVNAFEYGRANNIKYLFHYYKRCKQNLKTSFAVGLFDIL